MIRVSLRVSMSAIATVSPCCRKSVKSRSLRQLLLIIELSRMISPEAWIFSDSMSSLFVPVLPMCGYVRVTIWRQ